MIRLGVSFSFSIGDLCVLNCHVPIKQRELIVIIGIIQSEFKHITMDQAYGDEVTQTPKGNKICLTYHLKSVINKMDDNWDAFQ